MLIKRAWIPVVAGLAGTLLLSGLYLGIISWAESPRHAAEQFWQDRWIVLPILLGFGVQAGLYVTLRKRLFVPAADTGPSGALLGTGGGTSAVAMAACCAHHVADVLPILGLTAATAFLAQYRTAFMLAGLAATLAGISVMLVILIKERRKALPTGHVCAVGENL